MMVSSVLRVATLSAVVLAMTAPVISGDSPLNHLDGADLIDLLDAELDEDFLTQGFRNLQQFEMTGSPTPSPTAGSREFATASPTTATRDFDTASPTMAMGATFSPTMAAMDTPAPAAVVVETVAPTVSSGVVSWRPASALALVLVAAATAVMA